MVTVLRIISIFFLSIYFLNVQLGWERTCSPNRADQQISKKRYDKKMLGLRFQDNDWRSTYPFLSIEREKCRYNFFSLSSWRTNSSPSNQTSVANVSLLGGHPRVDEQKEIPR